MSSTRSTTLHAVRAENAGQLTAFRIAADLHAGDSVLVIGGAALARTIAELLGRPVLAAPTPRAGGRWALDRIVRRAASRARASRVVHYGMPGPGPEPLAKESWQGIAARVLPPRETARAGLGDVFVVVPLTDRPEAVDARTLVFLTGVLELVGQPTALLLPECARRLDEALTYHHNARLGVRLEIVEGTWIRAFPAADVFLRAADHNEPRPEPGPMEHIAACLGVPVVPTNAWRTDPSRVVTSLPAEIRAATGPLIKAARAASATVPA